MFPLRKKPAQPVAAQKPLSVIVADDVHEITQLVTLWLEQDGHSVTAVSTGRDVINLVRDRPVDLVITDLVMPGGNGLDAILAINRIRPTTRILAISGGGPKMPADAGLRVAKGLGADAVLLKPFGRESFKEAVQRATG
jgi:two-component system, chemotaxis family, chemotaxis protein CheY